MPISTLRPIAGIVIALFAAAPVQAERWQELPVKNGWTYKIDLDSLQWDGRTVKYRVEIVRVEHGVPHTDRITSQINCDTNQRRLIESEHFLSDGSSQKASHVDKWRPIEPWQSAEASRRFLCTDNQADLGLRPG